MSGTKDFLLIDKYVVDYTKMLGKGAMAKVYLGYYGPQQGDQQARFAVKQISVHSSLTVTDSLLLEINLLRKLNHPFILKYVDAKKSPKSLFLILQYCNGGTLQDLILNNKQGLSQQMIKKIIAQSVIALKFLKIQKIIHRDIKPKNILIHNGNIKISDFGVAKMITQHNQDKQTTTFSGTVQFMSPQILRQNKYTYQTDIWSLGVTIYFMVFGKYPWNSNKVLTILKEIQQEDGIQIPTTGISPQLRQIILKMLTNDQQNRITIQQLMQHPYLQGQVQEMQKQFYKQFYQQITTQPKQITKNQFLMTNQSDSVKCHLQLQRRSKQVHRSFHASQIRQQLALQAYKKLTNYKQQILFFEQILDNLRIYHQKKDVIEQSLFKKCQFLLVKRSYVLAKDLHQMILFGSHSQGNFIIPKNQIMQLIDQKKGKNNYNRALRDQVGRLYQKLKNDWFNTKQSFNHSRRTTNIPIKKNYLDAFQQSLTQSPNLIMAFNDSFMELFLKLSKGIVDTYAHRMSQEILVSNIVLNFGVNITFVYQLMIILCFHNLSQQSSMKPYKDKKKHTPCQQFIYRISLAYNKWIQLQKQQK